MSSHFINSVAQLIDETEKLSRIGLLLFRGQDCNAPLLPKIARDDCSVDTTDLEKGMLAELKRRTARNPTSLGCDDWDALVVAQHFGMATRLLDWTSNPLIALWFAIAQHETQNDGYIFLMPVSDDIILDRVKNPSPFRTGGTRVFRPSVNNDRLSVQAGWFTAHVHSRKSGKFVDLRQNTSLKHCPRMKRVRATDKLPFLKTLDRLGINQESLFPGLEGTCRYVDWSFRTARKAD